MPVGLQVKIGADVTGLMGAFQAAAGGAGSLTESLKATVASMSPIGAVGVAAADALIGMTNAAAEDRAEQEKLALVYDNAIMGMGDYTEQINAAIKAGADKAFSDSEVREGLTSLVAATGNAEEANVLLADAMDLARYANVPLAQASDALAKAHQGQTGALVKLVPGVAKYKDVTAQTEEALRLAAGASDVFADSSEGMQKKAGDAFGEIQEQIGSAFLPIIDALLPALLPFVELLGELISAVLPLLKPAIDIVVAALKILIEVLKAIIDGIKQVMAFIGDLIGKFQNAASAISSIDLNPFAAGGGGGGTPEMAGYSRSGRSSGVAQQGSTTVHIYGGDAWRTERAVRRGFQGWTSSAGPLAAQREF